MSVIDGSDNFDSYKTAGVDNVEQGNLTNVAPKENILQPQTFSEDKLTSFSENKNPNTSPNPTTSISGNNEAPKHSINSEIIKELETSTDYNKSLYEAMDSFNQNNIPNTTKGVSSKEKFNQEDLTDLKSLNNNERVYEGDIPIDDEEKNINRRVEIQVAN